MSQQQGSWPICSDHSLRSGLSKSLADKDLSSRYNNKQNPRLKELTINKLRYNDVGCVGREAEAQVLDRCLDQVLQHDPTKTDDTTDNNSKVSTKELILIQGYSGTGKTTLANGMENRVKTIKNSLFVRGKFDMNCRDQPYSGIAAAFTQACKHISANLGTKSINQFGLDLSLSLGSELYLLTRLIPDLDDILPGHCQVSKGTSKDFNAGADQERWKYAFRALTKTICSFFFPLVILLDDLQWADVASLDVMEYLLTDSENKSPFLMIGCYRSNEVDEKHVLTTKMQALREKKEKIDLNITEILVENVSAEAVNKILMAILGIDDGDTTKPLADVCYRRTMGNPFFLIEFVTMLKNEDLITFSLGLLKWVWDIETIERSTRSSDNVVYLLQSRMKKLADDVQIMLQYIACLGSSFTLQSLKCIWLNHSNSTDEKSLKRCLDALVHEKIIEINGSSLYSWVHDKVQEAALSIGDANSASFQFEFGTMLYRNLEQKDLEASLFDIVNLINRGTKTVAPELSGLNLQAAKKAKQLSAFYSAAKYAAKGISLLPTDSWAYHREMTIELYSIGADMELALGNGDKMEEYVTQAFEQGNCSPLEKLPMHLARIQKITTMERNYEGAINMCLTVLKELGCRLVPMKALLPAKALTSFLHAANTAKKKDMSFYQNMTLMTDKTQQAKILLLDRLFYTAYFDEKPFHMMAAVAEMVKLSFGHGINKMSGSAFAFLSLLTMGVLKDYTTGVFFAEAAVAIQEQVPSTYHGTTTLTVCYLHALSWKKPLQFNLDPLLNCYTYGMQSGNLVYGGWGIYAGAVQGPFLLGRPLKPLFERTIQVHRHLDELKQDEQASILKIYIEAIKNLMGETGNTTLLQGEYFDEMKWIPLSGPEREEKGCLKQCICILFGKYEEAGELALAQGDEYEKAAPGHFILQFSLFFRGMALYSIARKTRKLKYWHSARKILKRLKSLVKFGNPNVPQFYYLLNAEEAALWRNHDEATCSFKEAIIAAAKTGYLNYAGLACDRFAQYLMIDRGDMEGGKYQKERAMQFYESWGADALVKKLKDEM